MPDSRQSSPTSSVGSRASVSQSDRLLRSECRRQGGKNCGHVECQIRARRSAAAVQLLAGETPQASISTVAAATCDSPMTIWRPGGSSHLLLQQHEQRQLFGSAQVTTTTTSNTTTIFSSSSRVLRKSSTRDIAGSGTAYISTSETAAAIERGMDNTVMGAASSNNSNSTGLGLFGAMWSKTRAANSSDNDSDNSVEKGELEARYYSKEASGIFDDGNHASMPVVAETEAMVAQHGVALHGFAWFAMAAGTILRRVIFDSPLVVVMWLASIVATTISCLRSGVASAMFAVYKALATTCNSCIAAATNGLANCYRAISRVLLWLLGNMVHGVNSLISCAVACITNSVSCCFDSLYQCVTTVTSFSYRCIATLLGKTRVGAVTIASSSKSSVGAVGHLVLWLARCIQFNWLIRAACLPWYGLCSIVRATRHSVEWTSGCFNSVSTASAKSFRRHRSCCCLLLVLLIFLLALILLAFATTQRDRSAAAISTSKALASAWSNGCLAVHSGWFWMLGIASRLVAAGSAAVLPTKSSAQAATNSNELPATRSVPKISPPTPAPPPSILTQADFAALQQEVIALRGAIEGLKQASTQRLPPAPTPCPVPSDMASAAALEALILDIANFKRRLSAIEAATSAASDSAEAAKTAAAEASASVRYQQQTSAELRSWAEARTSATAVSVESSMADLKSRLEKLEVSIANPAPPPPPQACCQNPQVLVPRESFAVSVPADALPDFALHSAGGHVAGIRCTRQYNRRHSYLHLLGLPVLGFSNGPNTALQPGTQLGECWPFEGFPGHLIVRLAAPARVTAVTIDHVPRHLTYNNSAASAPRNFSVYGLRSEFDAFTAARHLGSYVYNAEAGLASQTFKVEPSDASAEIYPCVELVVQNNHGEEYTCLYRFRVHGALM